MKAPLIGQTINVDPTPDIIVFLLAVGFFILLFLIAREIVMWYWKINKIVGILERIESHLADGFKR